jgi:hypothetical protein
VKLTNVRTSEVRFAATNRCQAVVVVKSPYRSHKIEGILNTLGDLQQEMIAIAHCVEAEGWVAESAEEALVAARDRGNLLDSSQPVGKVLDQLIKEAQDLVVNGFKPKKK